MSHLYSSVMNTTKRFENVMLVCPFLSVIWRCLCQKSFFFQESKFCSTRDMDLHDAVNRGNLTSVRLLVVEQGADKDKSDRHGFTPLYIASHNGLLEVARYLGEQGASLDKASNFGCSTWSSRGSTLPVRTGS